MLQQMKRIADECEQLQSQVSALESEMKFLQDNFFTFLDQDPNLRAQLDLKMSNSN